jgi:hypothetical protein
VSGHEGGDDRQTQSGPSVVTAGRVGSVEPFEYSRCFFWRHAWAVVSDRQDHTASAGLVVNPAGNLDRDRRPSRRVLQRVSDQVGDDLPQAGFVTDDDGRRIGLADLQRDRTRRIEDTGVTHCVARKSEHVNRGLREWALLVEASQEQEILDEHPHALGFVLDATHPPANVGVVGRRALPV